MILLQTGTASVSGRVNKVAALLGVVFLSATFAIQANAGRVGKCEGTACKDVTVVYNAGGDNYTATNHGKKRVRVTLNNGAVKNQIDLNPGQSKGSWIKHMYIDPYHADYL